MKWGSGFPRARGSVQTPTRLLLQTEEVQPSGPRGRGESEGPGGKGREGHAWRDATVRRGAHGLGQRVFLGDPASVGGSRSGGLSADPQLGTPYPHPLLTSGLGANAPPAAADATPWGAQRLRGASTLGVRCPAGPAANRTGARTSLRAGAGPPRRLSAAVWCSCLLCPLG